MAEYRFALVAFLVCLAALAGMLLPWVLYEFGPEVSALDLGSPQLRVMV